MRDGGLAVPLCLMATKVGRSRVAQVPRARYLASVIDDPDKEGDDQWCAEQREQVIAYLSEEGFPAPTVGDWPAWHVAPVVSVWAGESIEHPGAVGWWAVSGDFPTDYTTCSGDRNPRQALRDIGDRWGQASARWVDRKSGEGFQLRNAAHERELAPLLATRAQLLLDLAADDRNWEECRPSGSTNR